MTGPVKAPALGRHVSFVAGLDGSGDRSPEHDEDAPREPHESHDLVLFDRYAECAECGARDHWPGIETVCTKIKPGQPGREPVTIECAIGIFLADLDAFYDWWNAKAHGTRPSIADWRAEFFEWQRHGGGKL
jgi:hypothetical protein